MGRKTNLGLPLALTLLALGLVLAIHGSVGTAPARADPLSTASPAEDGASNPIAAPGSDPSDAGTSALTPGPAGARPGAPDARRARSTPTPTATPTIPTATPTRRTRATRTPTPVTTTGASTATSTATPTAGPGIIPQPVVFVARTIPVDGSKFYSPEDGTNNYPGVAGWSRFVSAGPGLLQVLNPNGSVRTLLDGNHPDSTYHLADFNAPAVSYDGTKIVFAAVPSPIPASAAAPQVEPGIWRIYQINADGTGLTQLTFSNRNIDLSWAGSQAAQFALYDDTDPQFLPDGRIVFSSTRYPETAEYEGVVSTNLFVMNADGSNLHRITSEKGGADRPLVDPLTGQIVFSRWWRNSHFAVNSFATIYCGSNPDCAPGDSGDYLQHDGLTIDPGSDSTGITHGLDTNGWQVDAINPDGTGLHAFNMAGRDSRDTNVSYGGAFLADGRLVTNFFMPSNLAEEAGFGGLRLLVRGFNYYASIIGITTEYGQTLVPGASSDVFRSPTGYAAEAAPLSDGRLVIAWASGISQQYGLYAINLDGSNRTPLYTPAGLTATRPVVLARRPVPPIIPDQVTTTAPSVPPPVGGPYVQDGTFTYQNLNVYANAPVDAPIVNAPPVGSIATLRFYADPQQGGAIASIPETSWPVLLATATVTSAGAVTNPNAPADIPLFEQGRGPDGVTVPVTTDPSINNGVNGAAHVAGQNYGRPGTTVQCVGCHAGHSLIPVGPNPAFSNLAPGATVTVSSMGPAGQDGQAPATYDLQDRRVATKPSVSMFWRSADGQTQNQWVRLVFPASVTVGDVRLWNPPAGTTPYGDSESVQMLGATVRLFRDAGCSAQVGSNTAGTLSASGTDVSFANVTARCVEVDLGAASGTFDGQAVVSLAQVEVIAHG